MKFKNFQPLVLRQVEYFGKTISIPDFCEWVATSEYGAVMAWENKPDTRFGYWECHDDSGVDIPFIAGEFDPITEEDSLNSLRHYPIGEEILDKHQLDLAEAQLLGYAHCRDGYNLAALVDAMGLTRAEWKELQDKYAMHYLDDDDRVVITKYLSDVRIH